MIQQNLMHSSLARHLHSEECVKLIDKYEACMKEVSPRFKINYNQKKKRNNFFQSKYTKWIGACNKDHDRMSTCIKNQVTWKFRIRFCLFAFKMNTGSSLHYFLS